MHRHRHHAPVDQDGEEGSCASSVSGFVLTALGVLLLVGIIVWLFSWNGNGSSKHSRGGCHRSARCGGGGFSCPRARRRCNAAESDEDDEDDDRTIQVGEDGAVAHFVPAVATRGKPKPGGDNHQSDAGLVPLVVEDVPA